MGVGLANLFFTMTTSKHAWISSKTYTRSRSVLHTSVRRERSFRHDTSPA